ncbi:MAG TPA: SdpI family protein, partial [Polyangiaceae bacterium]|nr:SdpI family protein [Polyangiaceae bacterium]
FGSRLVPSDWRGRLKSSPVRVLCLITVGFLSALHVCVLHAALSPVKTLGSEVWVLMGAFFVMLGQILPRTRRNPFLGVRTTWTLTSDENWAQTHRMAGYAFTLGGAAVAVAGLLRAPALAMAVLAVTVLAPVVWLWRFAAREA